VVDPVIQPRTGKIIRSPKVVSRRSEVCERLLETAARMFVDKGVNNVSVEELLDAVSISRATFYGFFANKTELAANVMLPVFKSGDELLKRSKTGTPRARAEQLVDMYLELWSRHRHALLLTGMVDSTLFPYIKKAHEEFGAEILRHLQAVEEAGLLRNDSATLSYLVLAKTGIPLLRLYHKQPNFELIYRESMLALLLRERDP
jgi:AcrR family transcriptional regulator